MKFLINIALCVIFLIAYNAISSAQLNLVHNPSFEDISSCPSSYGQIFLAVGWNTPINGGGGNPELFHVCCSQPYMCGVPLNSSNSTFQYPHTGNAYTGLDVAFSAFLDNSREYIQSKLIRKLSTGHSYCVVFYASLSDQSLAYIRPLGAYFDNGSVSAIAPHGLAAVTPQVYNISQPLMDTINWMKIEGSFIANGNEEYITIGNFFTDASSIVGYFGTPTGWGSYYYIDDVSVIDADLPAYAGKDSTVHNPGDSVFIGRPSEVGLDEDCIWFVNGVPIDTIAGMWVKPDSTTTYVVQQTICGNVKYDTLIITVSGVGMGEYGWGGKVKVYPNPANEILTIDGFDGETTADIYSINGQLLSTLAVKEQQLDINFLANGMYFIKLSTKEGSVVSKFVKE